MTLSSNCELALRPYPISLSYLDLHVKQHVNKLTLLMLVILYELRVMLLKARANNLQLVHQSSNNVESVLYNVILDYEFAK